MSKYVNDIHKIINFHFTCKFAYVINVDWLKYKLPTIM